MKNRRGGEKLPPESKYKRRFSLNWESFAVNKAITEDKKTFAEQRALGVLAFLITTCIWGFAFIAQKSAMDYIGVFTMNGLRSLLGAVFLVPVIVISDLIKGKKPSVLGVKDPKDKKFLLVGGLLCGVFMTLASTLQQYGVKETTVTKAGFLSALYIIIVPVITVFFGKKIGWNGWAGVAIGILGMFLLCFNLGELKDLSINKGDLIIIVCSFFFSIHILVIDKYSPATDAIRLSCIQFIVCGVTCTILAFIFENPQWENVKAAGFAIFFAGVVSCGIGYTLQMVGQKFVPAHIAPLLMGLECVFSLIADWIFYQKLMTAQEYIGCLLIFIAIILAQLDFSAFVKKPAEAAGLTEAVGAEKAIGTTETAGKADKNADATDGADEK